MDAQFYILQAIWNSVKCEVLGHLTELDMDYCVVVSQGYTL